MYLSTDSNTWNQRFCWLAQKGSWTHKVCGSVLSALTAAALGEGRFPCLHSCTCILPQDFYFSVTCFTPDENFPFCLQLHLKNPTCLRYESNDWQMPIIIIHIRTAQVVPFSWSSWVFCSACIFLSSEFNSGLSHLPSPCSTDDTTSLALFPFQTDQNVPWSTAKLWKGYSF